LALESSWRQNRLPILCFHGVSTADEHECFPGLFIPQEMFRKKLAILRDLGIQVLELDEAVKRLAAKTLPPRSAVITIDDGYYGVYSKGARILSEFGFPASVHIPTHYVCNNRPVFDNMCGYLLWRASGRELQWRPILREPVLLDSAGRRVAEKAIRWHASCQQLSSEAKNELLADLAFRLDIDWNDLCRRRMFHLVNPDEMRTWRTVRFELHTHRHRSSTDRATFRESLQRNAEELHHITGYESRHLAYPGGTYLPQYVTWLRELGVASATTCNVGLASVESNPWLLPRITDTSNLTATELRSWLTGVASVLPVRSHPIDTSQFEAPVPQRAAAWSLNETTIA